MSKRTLCGLRTHRRLWGLNQTELATLLGVRGADQISRLESGERTPSLEVALACELLFDLPPDALFAQVRQKVEELLIRRVYAMHERLSKESSAAAQRKRELLESCLKRVVINIKKDKL